jgi:hypothetical protein
MGSNVDIRTLRWIGQAKMITRGSSTSDVDIQSRGSPRPVETKRFGVPIL